MLSQCHVKTIVSNSYNEVIVALREHYNEVFQVLKNGPAFEEGLPKANLLALADKKDEDHDFSTNNNPMYWIRKLKNKAALLKECNKRGIIIDNAMATLNNKIVETLIVADSK